MVRHKICIHSCKMTDSSILDDSISTVWKLPLLYPGDISIHEAVQTDQTQ